MFTDATTAQTVDAANRHVTRLVGQIGLPRTRRIRWSWINGVGCRHRRQRGNRSARGSKGVMVGGLGAMTV